MTGEEFIKFGHDELVNKRKFFFLIKKDHFLGIFQLKFFRSYFGGLGSR